MTKSPVLHRSWNSSNLTPWKHSLLHKRLESSSQLWQISFIEGCPSWNATWAHNDLSKVVSNARLLWLQDRSCKISRPWHGRRVRIQLYISQDDAKSFQCVFKTLSGGPVEGSRRLQGRFQIRLEYQAISTSGLRILNCKGSHSCYISHATSFPQIGILDQQKGHVTRLPREAHTSAASMH